MSTLSNEEKKQALSDLRYYTVEYLTDPRGALSFWKSEQNRARHLVPLAREILNSALTSESVKILGLLNLVFLSNTGDAALKNWSYFLYQIGNGLFLTLELEIPVDEWAELAEEGRQLLVQMSNGDTSSEIKQQWMRYEDRTYQQKEQFRSDPRFRKTIESRDNQ